MSTQPESSAEEKLKEVVPKNPKQQSDLKEIQTNQDLSKWMSLKSTKLLTWLCKSKQTHYSISKIPKRNGKFRIIHNPDHQLRVAQYLALNKILNLVEIPDYIWGFESSKSIPEMASKHVGKYVVLSMDIKDFFPSIKQAHIKRILVDVLGIGEAPAITLSELCTYKAFVPQGALTSPKISNIVAANTFGPEVAEYCTHNGYTLTIYADDITISSDTRITDIGADISTVQSILEKYGFRANLQKTKVMPSTSRQWVCGVVTNTKTNMLRKDRLRLRAAVHNISKNGIEVEAAKFDTPVDRFQNQIQGRINWFRQLNADLGGRLFTKFKNVVGETTTTV